MGHKAGGKKRVKNEVEVLSLGNWKVNGAIRGNGWRDRRKVVQFGNENKLNSFICFSH